MLNKSSFYSQPKEDNMCGPCIYSPEQNGVFIDSDKIVPVCSDNIKKKEKPGNNKPKQDKK